MAITFSEKTSVASPLWDYGWFDLTRFSVRGAPAPHDDPTELLVAFAQDPIWQRSFCTQPGPWGVSIGRHGPFLQQSVGPGWFRLVAHEELTALVQAVLTSSDFDTPPSPAQQAVVDSWLAAAMARGDAALVLEAPNKPGVRVDWDVWSLFHEFITVSPDHAELVVAVVGYD